jgi:hypothetical protein
LADDETVMGSAKAIGASTSSEPMESVRIIPDALRVRIILLLPRKKMRRYNLD